MKLGNVIYQYDPFCHPLTESEKDQHIKSIWTNRLLQVRAFADREGIVIKELFVSKSVVELFNGSFVTPYGEIRLSYED